MRAHLSSIRASWSPPGAGVCTVSALPTTVGGGGVWAEATAVPVWGVPGMKSRPVGEVSVISGTLSGFWKWTIRQT
jgi:hypothetical protein